MTKRRTKTLLFLAAVCLTFSVFIQSCDSPSQSGENGNQASVTDNPTVPDETVPAEGGSEEYGCETIDETVPSTQTDEPESDESPDSEPAETTAGTDAEETETETEVIDMERIVENRYFIFRIWNFHEMSLPDFKSTVDAAEQTGFNAIKVHIPWYLAEPTEGDIHFDAFDQMIDYVVNQKSMSVAISLDFTRNINGFDRMFSTDSFMADANGAVSLGGVYNRSQISFCSDYAVERACVYYETAVRHFESKFGDTGKILFYLPAFSQYCETEYWCTADFDYSDNAVRKYRIWLTEKYGDVSELNRAYGTDFQNFSGVQPPASTQTKDKRGLDWYIFRHTMLKSVIDKLSDIQHGVSPESKFAIQLGCVFDGAAILRGTVGFIDLCEKVDVLWVDDGPSFNHDWSMDYLLSALPASVELAQEIDGPTQVDASRENYLNQGLTSFEKGCTYLSIANWSINSAYREYEDVWEQISSTWIQSDRSVTVSYPEGTPDLTVSLYKVFRNGTTSYMNKYVKLSDKGERAVRIIIENDLTG